MAKYTIIDMKNVAIDGGGLKMVKPPAVSFKVEVDIPKEIEKEAAKDPLLQQEFKDAANEIRNLTVEMIQKKLKIFDNLFVEMIKKGADEKDVKKQIDGLNAAVKNDMVVAQSMAVNAANEAWKDLCDKRKEWKKFKIKVAASITATIVGLAISIAAMASSPWSGGAGAAFAIIGFIKAGTKLAQDIAKIAMDIDAAKKQVDLNLAVVEKAVQSKLANAANEVSAAVFQEFLGISQPSVKTTVSAMDTLKAKYAQMVVNVHDLSKSLNKALEGQEKLKKEFLSQVADRLKKHPTTDKAGQMKKIQANFEKELEKSGNKIMGLIGEVGALYEKIKGWAKTVTDLSKRVKELEIKDPKALKVFREALKFCMLATSIFDGNKVATDMQNIATGIITASELYVYDKLVSKAVDNTIFDAA